MKKRIFSFIFLLLVIFIVGCNGKEEIYLDFSDTEIEVTLGDEFNLSLDTNIEDLSEVTITFSETGFVTEENAKFIAAKAGQVTAKATWDKDKSVQAQATITINDIKREIKFTEEEININTEEEFELILELTNLEYTDLGYKFSESNIVSINNEWVISPKAAGSTILTVFYLDNDKIDLNIQINVEEVKEFYFTEDVIEMDGSANVVLPFEYKGYELNDIGFMLSNQAVISRSGMTITALRDGTVTVKAFLKTDPTIFEEITVVVEFPKPLYTIFDTEYWLETLDSKYDPHEIIYTVAEIEAYNLVVASDYSKTNVVVLLDHPTSGTKQEVTSEIESYNNMNRYTVYNDETHQAITNADKNAVLARRNLDAIPANVEFEYGIVTDFARMRSYPTNFYSQGEALDRFQETSLNVGEGVVIKHTSSDGLWYFVQANNYKGWVEAINIGKTDFETMEGFLTAEDFIVITADKIDILGAPARMGQRFPYNSKDENNYNIQFPTRNESGDLVLENTDLSTDEDFSEGYLDYTYANVIELAFKLIGITYSWGDKYLDGRDCSSSMVGIFGSFGFILPRNTSNQNKVPNYSTDTTGSNRLTLQSLKEDYRPGTMLFSSGHVMLYIGEDVDGVSWMFHTTTGTGGTSPLQGAKLQTVSSYGINSMIATLKTYEDSDIR